MGKLESFGLQKQRTLQQHQRGKVSAWPSLHVHTKAHISLAASRAACLLLPALLISVEWLRCVCAAAK